MLSPALRFAALAATLSTIKPVAALDFPANDPDALSSVVKQISNGVVEFDVEDYGGIGLFPDPYTWSESATAWDSLVAYWYLTGDTTHNAAVQAALVGQMGQQHDFMVPNQSLHLTNWRQSSWALAALSAAERGLPVGSENKNEATSWEDLARNAFDTQAARWDGESCGGGLRTDIYVFNENYNSKDSVSQSSFFQLAARLARFTGNQTYVDWAVRTYDWMRETKLIGDDFAVHNVVSTTQNCSQVDDTQFSEAAAAIAYGSAVLANFTSEAEWANRTASHVDHLLSYFFPSDVLTEPACKGNSTSYCQGEAHAAEASALRWLALIPVFQPATYDRIHTALEATAKAAAHPCTAAEDGEAASASCQGLWSTSSSDDDNGVDQVQDGDDDDNDDDVPRNATTGLGQQLTALEALQSGFILTADGVNASFVLATVNGTAAVTSSINGNGSLTSTGGGASGASSSTQTGAAAGDLLRQSSSAAWGSLVIAGLVGFGTAVLV